ncbi:MAG TPA: hypothetical protein VHZ26_16895 [Caulobacteraceae bacterium]|jgi:hypothetical protein|nr:hypothetical protein [Caulobacteraceae bacterium]
MDANPDPEPPDPELQAAAAEELAQAVRLSWRELARLVPYGDTYEGFGPAGGALEFERSYIWRDLEGGDILCEVIAFRGLSRYDHGARACQVIAKPK